MAATLAGGEGAAPAWSSAVSTSLHPLPQSRRLRGGRRVRRRCCRSCHTRHVRRRGCRRSRWVRISHRELGNCALGRCDAQRTVPSTGRDSFGAVSTGGRSGTTSGASSGYKTRASRTEKSAWCWGPVIGYLQCLPGDRVGGIVRTRPPGRDGRPRRGGVMGMTLGGVTSSRQYGVRRSALSTYPVTQILEDM